MNREIGNQDGMQSDKDIGIVVAAHAPLATALVRTVTTIVPNAQLLAVDLVPSQDADGALSLMDEAVKAADLGNGVLVLADLFGGTAANLALSQLGDGKVEVLTGANLAMVLDAVTHASSAVSAGKLALRAAKAAESSVVVASALLTPSSDEIQAA